MRKNIAIAFLLFCVYCSAIFGNDLLKPNQIKISYGIHGKEPLYSYTVSKSEMRWIDYELNSKGKRVNAGRVDCDASIHDLAIILFGELLNSHSEVDSSAKENGEKKSITVEYYHGNILQACSVSGSDEALNHYLQNTKMVRDLFIKLSTGQPKLYRLLDEVGPLKSIEPYTQP